MPPEAGYPASLADVNFAVRWCKARAAELGSRPDRVGILGVSSGGHQAMLTAMRPDDPRYAAVPSTDAGTGLDASVRCVVLCWPVIDPLGRYHYAKELKARGDSKTADEFISSHDKYWGTEAAMAEGNPTLALERGETVRTPPVLYLQGTADTAHPAPHRDRFIASYKKAGGRVELHLFEGVGEAFITNDPHAPASLQAIERIIEFVHREMR
jgi:acetyl esterase/lipase